MGNAFLPATYQNCVSGLGKPVGEERLEKIKIAKFLSLDFISEKYGDNYVGKPRTKKIKNSQEAHEAIRPTNLEANIDSLKPEEKRIYNEIKNCSLQSASPSKFLSLS